MCKLDIYIIISIIIICIGMCMLLLLYFTHKKVEKFYYDKTVSPEFKYIKQCCLDSSDIPNVIYTYWHDENNIPETVNKCIQSWKKHNPTYKIVVLNSSNLQDYIPFDMDLPAAKTHQQKADFIRIYVLAHNGGFWLDATVYEPLTWVHTYQHIEKSEYVGYYIDVFTTNKEYPVIENWFFACIPNSPFMLNWYNTFYRMNEFNNPKEFVEYLKPTTNFQNIDDTEYLTMQHVLQNSTKKFNLSLLKAENGPFLYNILYGWNNSDGLEKFVKYRPKKYHPPLIKFRSIERKVIEDKTL